MSNPFFDQPILNSPYKEPERHWELDETGQPTQQIKAFRRPAKFITPIPKPKKRGPRQTNLFESAAVKALSASDQQYEELTGLINSLRQHLEEWRALPEKDWKVTAETARLLKHWRHHQFS
ncbi:MAG TPA: restriction endonuclease, partial [Desulfobulbaceae bacterium]|nr:restriction endonuclease [Desulfobulbaceae bacterium]